MANDTKKRTAEAASVYERPSMSDKDFKRFSEFIYAEVGIKLPPTKKTMIEAPAPEEAALHPGMSNHTDYVEYLFSKQGMEKELFNLIDVVTTNTTDFFREPKHFEILTAKVLPPWYRLYANRTLNLWSAGCSFGMEPYTLAMVMADFAEQNSGFKFNILATDISTQALQTAVRAVYDMERVRVVPQFMKKKYLLRSKDSKKKMVRIAPELRRVVEFRRLNFMEEFHFQQPMDIIFCRNVVIYFDKPTQLRLFKKFCRSLRQGGHLFIGHSESLAGMDLPLDQVAPTVYRRK